MGVRLIASTWSVPPELEDLTRQEILELHRVGLRYSLKLMGGSVPAAEDLVEKAWVALHTTRRWDPSRGQSLPSWFRGVIMTYALHAFWDTAKQTRAREPKDAPPS